MGNQQSTDYQKKNIHEEIASYADGVRKNVTYCANNLAIIAKRNSANRKLIVEAGAIGPLVHMLSHGGDSGKAHAADALGYLAIKNPANQKLIVEAGAIGPLVYLLQSGNDAIQERVSCVLSWLAKNSTNRDLILKAGALAPLVCLLSVTNHKTREAVSSIFCWLCRSAQIRDRIIRTGSVTIDPLVRLLSLGTDLTKQYAAYCISRLAKNEMGQDLIEHAGAIVPLVRLLSEGTVHAKEHAAFALLHLALGPESCLLMMQSGVIGPMMHLLAEGGDKTKEHAAGFFANFAYQAPLRQDIIRQSGVIELLIDVLREGVTRAKDNAAIALAHIADNNAVNQNWIARAGATGPLVHLLSSTNNSLLWRALWALNNLVKDNPVNRAAIISDGALEKLKPVCQHKNTDIKEKAKQLMGFLQPEVVQVLSADSGISKVGTAGVVPLSAKPDRHSLAGDSAMQKFSINRLDVGTASGAGGGGASAKREEKVQERLQGSINHLQPESLPKKSVETSQPRPVTKHRSALDKQGLTKVKGDLDRLVLDASAVNSAALPGSGGGAGKSEALPMLGLVMPAGVGMIAFSELSYNANTDFIAAGCFGKVYKATWQGAPVALKILLLQDVQGDALEELQHESAMMTRLRHPNVIDFYGTCMEPGHYALVMAYMSKGSLYHVLQNQAEVLSWPARYKISHGVGSGIAFLHSRQILHRDLKSLNVLMDENNKPKLADFGLSKLKKQTTTKKTQGGAVGTLAWMAPELLEPEQAYEKSCDIFSLGVILWELASRQIPWADAHSPALIPLWLVQGEREQIPVETPAPFAALIAKCWAQKPEERPQIEEVVTEFKQLIV